MIDVLRKTCIANQKEVFVLKALSVAFQVKNLTKGHAFACMGFPFTGIISLILMTTMSSLAGIFIIPPPPA